MTEEEHKTDNHLTVEALQALPVDTLVYSRYGKEYRVALWPVTDDTVDKILIATEDGGGMRPDTFERYYGPGTLTPPPAPVELTTPAELHALPVGTMVYDEAGYEYRVELWADHGGNGGDGRVLIAPGHKSGVEAFLNSSHAYLQRPPAITQQEDEASRYGLSKSGGAYSFGYATMTYAAIDLDAIDHNRRQEDEPNPLRRFFKTEVWEFPDAIERDGFVTGWRTDKRYLLAERFTPAWSVTGGWPGAGL